MNPKVTLKKFVPLCSNKVLSLTEYEDVQLEEELDNVILFNLQILAEVILQIITIDDLLLYDLLLYIIIYGSQI